MPATLQVAVLTPRAHGSMRKRERGTWRRRCRSRARSNGRWHCTDEKVDGESRVITSNGLPVGAVTGTFPIAADDPAYQYDRNPTRSPAAMTMTLPVTPTEASSPGCMGMGVIGVMKNGVSLFAPVDELNRDAVAYETQDSCDGHPQQASVYHYHNIPSCILDASTGASTVVGFMTMDTPSSWSAMPTATFRPTQTWTNVMVGPRRSLWMARSLRRITIRRPTSSRTSSDA